MPISELHWQLDGMISVNQVGKMGAHGLVIVSEHTTLWEGAVPSDGHTKLMSPYQAELSGILAGLKCLTLSNNITIGLAYMFCDCEKAIKVINRQSKGMAESPIPRQ